MSAEVEEEAAATGGLAEVKTGWEAKGEPEAAGEACVIGRDAAGDGAQFDVFDKFSMLSAKARGGQSVLRERETKEDLCWVTYC